ncbi:MAG: HAMP domain-containing sensor histidine kinase [Candidatus Saccharimonas sp.]
MKRQDDFVGDVFRVPSLVAAAHELKAPLALIRQLALYGSEYEAEGDAANRDVLLERIRLTSERALRLTTDLTKAMRVEDSLFALEPVNPLTLCEEVVSEISPLYQSKGREVVVAKRQRQVLGLANRDLLRRILLNFTDNALHYSSPDEPVVISTTIRDKGQSIRLSVRDHGPAMPAQTWRVLHDRMGKSAQPLHNRPESSGLGMLISQYFADAMQAKLGAVRHSDGVTFYVDINASTQMRLL